MTIGKNTALRRRLAGSVLGGLIAFAAVPAAMAQWLPPWRVMAWSGDIAGRLQAQGYVLMAPLQRRPGVYLADVRAGPAGYQRLVIDDRTGQILERFGSPPGNFGPAYAVRYNEFADRPPPGVIQLPYGPGFSDGPNGGPAARSAYSGPTNARIPSAISPFELAAGAALDEVEAEVRRNRPQDSPGGSPAGRWAASAAPRSARGGETGRIGPSGAQAGAEGRLPSGRQGERLVVERARGA